ncbi:MAG: hypothetical protein A3C84_00725 [Candidatus Ryanbacteria bacterium RIFCSPHIGHO2_02_FULL_48_12]|uniref:Uncharacterized protein n=1 Tax=Candidatus Ryanbacteria bacterium RIFCSPHIGHO2_01_FULL_48_27 TaxID=1802115 RepID=A0A1G2G6G4_9BACT|nr:MAG: hypothetical protein A2756_02645 [Candidatus Ryanbacteria bacterium RIFCSPHIGHO2_01_FULL_48_27]OGZ49306.1 MAG: hypothetical protein A3C84_00725 [Candidatus Ryanbacteria bacterium RIFCSPHIGHO2_02_FULL_48_12]
MRLSAKLEVELQITTTLPEPILSKQWPASNGEENIWGFYIYGDEVLWGYSALFDRETGEHSRSYVLFERASFHKCLHDICIDGAETGCIKSTDTHAGVKFWSNTKGAFFMTVHDSNGDSLSWNLEPLTYAELRQALQALE